MTRIVAGSRGGRRIAVPRGTGTRPTTDRVREALFSAVAAWAGTADRLVEDSLSGLSFCDLYAGSGAVGLEAASRGAAPVLLIEADRMTAQLIRRNAADLGLVVEVAAARVELRLRQPPATAYDVVFADPPYELDAAALDGLLEACVEQRWISPDGLLILERSRRTRDPVWPSVVADTWTRAYGETTLHFGSLG